jgi:hypothetical protein
MIKKIVTVFLSMILAISFLPVSVDAAGTDPATILTDPAFDLNTIDPGTLQQWYASEVSVPDASLKKALMNAANVASGGTLTVKDMLSLPTTLDLSGLSITNLTGMQYAINLKKLNVSNNSISSWRNSFCYNIFMERGLKFWKEYFNCSIDFIFR